MTKKALLIGTLYLVAHLMGTWLYLTWVPATGGRSFEVVVLSVQWLVGVEIVLLVFYLMLMIRKR